MKHTQRILCSNFYPQENVLGLSEARPIDSITVFTPQPYVHSMEFRNDNDIYSNSMLYSLPRLYAVKIIFQEISSLENDDNFITYSIPGTMIRNPNSRIMKNCLTNILHTTLPMRSNCLKCSLIIFQFSKS